MQTNFSLAALADPHMRESEKILRSCVHCGFCTATCPTYLLLGDELDSPRGRIYQIKDMLEKGRPASAEVVQHLDRCLSCLSCMTTCPSGVHYMHLVDHARAHVEATHKRPFADRAMRALLATVLPNRALFRFSLFGAKMAKPFAPLWARVPVIGARLAAMLSLAPARFAQRSPAEKPGVWKPPASERPARRVILMNGCAQSVLRPEINDATIRLLNRLGVEVVIALDEGCCGALVHHMGREERSLAQARRNVDAWTTVIEGGGVDAILITASGCGTTVKDYGFMLREDPLYAAKARRVSELARDVSEYLATLDIAPTRATGQVVAYHSACSMQHGQKITDAPKQLLRAAGFKVKDVPEGHICCGSAGVYNIMQPEIASRLKARKQANIARTKPQIVAAGNIGCMTQLEAGLGAPIVHTVELIDWATGGPRPQGLEGVAGL